VPFFEILLVAFGLASDAFAVSVGAGSTGATKGSRSMLRLSFHLGLFQFLMPVIGWLAGLSIQRYVFPYSHWAAFGLLVWVGLRMIYSARDGRQASQQDPSRGMLMVILSVATSLDALAVGLSLALVQVSIWYPAVVIGIVTGLASFVGILLGRKFSKKLGTRASIAGGLILICIGARIILGYLAGK
jgi:putative Mn2+ efflux pump MntP